MLSRSRQPKATVGRDDRPTTLNFTRTKARLLRSLGKAVGGCLAGAGHWQPAGPPRESGPHRWRPGCAFRPGYVPTVAA